MTQEELYQLKEDVEYLKKGITPTKNIFTKLIVAVNGLKFKGDPVIVSGSKTTDASIKLDVGTLPKGSIYLSTNGVGEVWVMQTTTWTKLTIN
jgi:hypothetical protein